MSPPLRRALTPMAPIASLCRLSGPLVCVSAQPGAFCLWGNVLMEVFAWLAAALAAVLTLVPLASLATTWLFRWLQRPRPLVRAAWRAKAASPLFRAHPSIVAAVTGRGSPTSVTAACVRLRSSSEAGLPMGGPRLPAKLAPGDVLTFERPLIGGAAIDWAARELDVRVSHGLSGRPIVARVVGPRAPHFMSRFLTRAIRPLRRRIQLWRLRARERASS